MPLAPILNEIPEARAAAVQDTPALAPVMAPAPPVVTPPVSKKITPTFEKQPSALLKEDDGLLSGTNIRRLLYGLLIFGIGGLAYYLTRTPTGGAKIDMLELVTSQTEKSNKKKVS